MLVYFVMGLSEGGLSLWAENDKHLISGKKKNFYKSNI